MQLEGLWLPRWRSDTEAHLHFVEEMVYSGKSSFQRIEIVRLRGYGKCLMLDGIHQSAELDEFIYQEAIVHPALFLHPNPRKVLIIGAGAGNVLREVLKHPGVESVVMVEIDEMVVDVCRQYLGWEQGAYEDPRTTLVIGDGAEYIANSDIMFDCIIVDSTTPRPGSIAFSLYGAEFFAKAYSKLADHGILCGLQSNANILYLDSHRTIRSTMMTTFQQVLSYMTYCPFYAISYMFCLSIKGHAIDPENVSSFSDRLRQIQGKLHFYDTQTHKHMFALPLYVRSRIYADAELMLHEQLIRY